ncbi:MAG: hypothetical protein WC485_04085 [Opitutaceae bacterium]
MVTLSCPHLPPAPARMDWRDMRTHGSDRGPAFYLTALEYSQCLWQQGRPARAILCLDRAFGAELQGGASVLAQWPPPYAALAWLLAHTPPGVFLGNPRVHFQHLAGRMNAPRRELRRWRAWACWAISHRILPHLAGDPQHQIVEPTPAVIAEKLSRHGLPGETARWREVFAACSPAR